MLQAICQTKLSASKVLTKHVPVHCQHVHIDLPHTCNEIPSGHCCGSQVAVLYASDYGFSDRLSQTIARGITKANVAVEMLDLLSADPQVHHPYCRRLSLRSLLCINGLITTFSVCGATGHDIAAASAELYCTSFRMREC